jgi:hypothetical protein
MSLRYDTKEVLCAALIFTNWELEDVELWLTEDALTTKWYIRANIFSVKHKLEGEINEESVHKTLSCWCKLTEEIGSRIQEAIKKESLN